MNFLGLLNISLSWHINAQEETAIISWRECSKKSVQQGRSHFGARSVHGVREHGKRARTPLVAFFNIPFLCNDWRTAFSMTSQEVLPVGQNVMALYPSCIMPVVCGGYYELRGLHAPPPPADKAS